MAMFQWGYGILIITIFGWLGVQSINSLKEVSAPQ
jgi:hypothetical protein